MDAKHLIRRYLEQRRESGESEFVLDSLSVAEAMRLIGAAAGNADEETKRRGDESGTPPSVRREMPSPTPRERASAVVSDDWRETLRAAGAEPGAGIPGAPGAPGAPVAKPARGAAESGPILPVGLVVGSASTELFGGPLARVQSLDELAGLIASCKSCALHSTAKNPVPGEGSPHARLVCVGEAPGATEDETGRPFVGQAGQLLTKILEAVKLSRDEVFICNVLKHRPPGNRNPAPDEIVACRPFLMRQLDFLRPKVILALGTFAAQTLLETKLAIGKLRGQVHTFYGTPLVVTYHPAALLRNSAWKRPTWEDVQLARRLLDRTTDGA